MKDTENLLASKPMLVAGVGAAVNECMECGETFNGEGELCPSCLAGNEVNIY